MNDAPGGLGETVIPTLRADWCSRAPLLWVGERITKGVARSFAGRNPFPIIAYRLHEIVI
jgi:hypothetical protein